MPSPTSEPPALHDRAIADLSFIRQTMAGAASFTDVPGRGLMGVGVIGLVGAGLGARQATAEGWLQLWLATAVVAMAVGVATLVHKMRRRATADAPFVLSTPARKFILGFVPALLAGAVLTLALIDLRVPGVEPHLADRLLAGIWLLLYGVGVTTAGAHSIRAVPLMGMGFIGLGVIALLLPADADLMMALGFGALHLGFGLHIARRHGG